MASKRRSVKHASTIRVRSAGGGKFNYAYQGPRPGQWDELDDLSAQEIFRKVAAILKMYPRTVVVLPKYTLGPRSTAVKSGELPFVVYSEPHGQEVMADHDPKALWNDFGKQLLRGVRNIKKPESGRPAPGWEDRSMDLNDLMHELREPMDEAAGADYMLKGAGAPDTGGKFGAGAKDFWAKTARMVRGGLGKPEFLMSHGKPEVLMSVKLPNGSGLKMKGSVLVRFNPGGWVAVEVHVWFPELPGGWMDRVGKPWKGYFAVDDRSFKPGADISGGKLVKLLTSMIGTARLKAKKDAAEGNWAQYKGQKESVESDDTQGLMESLRHRAGLIEG